MLIAMGMTFGVLIGSANDWFYIFSSKNMTGKVRMFLPNGDQKRRWPERRQNYTASSTSLSR